MASMAVRWLVLVLAVSMLPAADALDLPTGEVPALPVAPPGEAQDVVDLACDAAGAVPEAEDALAPLDLCADDVAAGPPPKAKPDAKAEPEAQADAEAVADAAQELPALAADAVGDLVADPANAPSRGPQLADELASWLAAFLGTLGGAVGGAGQMGADAVGGLAGAVQGLGLGLEGGVKQVAGTVADAAGSAGQAMADAGRAVADAVGSLLRGQAPNPTGGSAKLPPPTKDLGKGLPAKDLVGEVLGKL